MPAAWSRPGRTRLSAISDSLPSGLDDSSLEIENTYLDIVRAVKIAVRIPVAVKMSPYFSNMANMAKRLDEAGADALVLFNRFYQPDFDLETLEFGPMCC